MSEHERVAASIPWLANGSLDDETRRSAERHLADCPSCRGLLALARAFHRVGSEDPADLDEHVQAQLLVEFHERHPDLGGEVRGRIDRHLADCAVCREAVTILDELVERRPPPPVRMRLWQALQGSVLRPLPALAYLVVAIALLVPAMRGWRTAPVRPVQDPETAAPRAPVVTLPGFVRVPGERAYRSGPEEAVPPLTIAPPATGDVPVVLELEADLDREDLDDPDAAFLVELLDGETAVFRDTRPGSAFDALSRLRVLLHPARLEPGRPYVWTIRYVKPGDPFHGETVFRREVRIAESQEGKSP